MTESGISKDDVSMIVWGLGEYVGMHEPKYQINIQLLFESLPNNEMFVKCCAVFDKSCAMFDKSWAIFDKSSINNVWKVLCNVW